MTREKLLNLICDVHPCADFNLFFNNWLDEYDKHDKHIIEQYNADTNLKDTIREIHDNVAQEMYCKGVDDLTEKLKDYFVIPHDARVIEMMAEQLKEQNK